MSDIKLGVSVPTKAEFSEAVQTVRRELRAADDAWMNVNLGPLGNGDTIADVYAAAERCQHAAFELKNLFSIQEVP